MLNKDLEQIITEYKAMINNKPLPAASKKFDSPAEQKKKPPVSSSTQIDRLIEDITSSGLLFSKQMLARFVSSLATKPFVILTGLSGSGKTKLAQAFAKWICLEDSRYCIVPVGADWTNREPLLGYRNALKPVVSIISANLFKKAI